MPSDKSTLLAFCGFLSVREDVPECGTDKEMDSRQWSTLVDEFVEASTSEDSPDA